MSNHTHETAPTQFVEEDGIRYPYRRFGRAGTVPLLFLGYFNSNMDAWDPAVTNSLAADHEVILFDNAGVGASGGKTRIQSLRWTLVVHGNKHIAVTPINAFILEEHLPNARTRIQVMERTINAEKAFLEQLKIFLSDEDSVVPDQDSIKSSVAQAGYIVPTESIRAFVRKSHDGRGNIQHPQRRFQPRTEGAGLRCS